MANYILTSCDELTQIVVNAGETTILLGNVYYMNFTGETNPGCFTVTDETINPEEDVVFSAVEYSNCLECLQQNNWSFEVVVCGIETGGPVNANQFTEWPLGGYYRLCLPPDFVEDLPECFCVNVIGISDNVIEPFFGISGPFENCDCPEPPRSANTEVTICVEVCDNNVVNVNPPHPVWTDEYGTQVTQLNMVTLGGPNGLNN
jgi:hypothetical protein